MVVMALVLAAAAALLLVPRPRGLPGRREGPEPPAWLRAREGAMALRLRVLLGAVLGVAVFLAAEGSGPVLALGLGVLLGAGGVVVLGRIEPGTAQKEREQRIRDLPHALELLAGCLRSGLPLRRAVREVGSVMGGPVGADLAFVVGLLDVGVDERTAWLALADRPGWGLMARDIARAAESGSGLRGTLDRHATRARVAAHALRQQQARTIGVRSVLPLVACFLPAFVLVGIVPTVGSMVARFLGGF